MYARLIATTLLLGSSALAGGMAGSATGAPRQAAAMTAAPNAAALDQASLVTDDAVATALIVAIRNEFGQDAVEVTLGKLAVTPAGMVQSEIAGAGKLRLGADGEWTPFRFAALYDAASASVGYPRLSFAAKAGKAVSAHAPIATALHDEVARRLHREFAQQSAEVALGQVRLLESGGRYVQVAAEGLVDFGREGTAPATVQGTYDRQARKWVRVDYALDGEPATAVDALAVR